MGFRAVCLRNKSNVGSITQFLRQQNIVSRELSYRGYITAQPLSGYEIAYDKVVSMVWHVRKVLLVDYGMNTNDKGMRK